MTTPQPIAIDMGNLIIHHQAAFQTITDQEILAKSKESLAFLITSLYELKKTQKAKELVLSTYEVELPDKTQEFPRAYPLPKERPETKWERFKKLKGIRQIKKRSRLVYDDASKNWVPRWGKGSIKKIHKKDDWIKEDKD